MSHPQFQSSCSIENGRDIPVKRYLSRSPLRIQTLFNLNQLERLTMGLCRVLELNEVIAPETNALPGLYKIIRSLNPQRFLWDLVEALATFGPIDTQEAVESRPREHPRSDYITQIALVSLDGLPSFHFSVNASLWSTKSRFSFLYTNHIMIVLKEGKYPVNNLGQLLRFLKIKNVICSLL